MNNTYMENLARDIESGKLESSAVCTIVRCYKIAKYYEADIITCDEVLWESDAATIVAVLRKAGINELYITAQASDMFGVYLLLDNAGLKLRGVVQIENPKYKKDMDKWGSSFEKRYIPALRFSFQD